MFEAPIIGYILIGLCVAVLEVACCLILSLYIEKSKSYKYSKFIVPAGIVLQIIFGIASMGFELLIFGCIIKSIITG